MNWIKRFSILVLAGTVCISCGNKEKQTGEMSSADYVEQASFSDFNGNPVPLSDFKGKVVMIDFWETWCRPCIDSFPTMQKLVNDYPDDFVVLAVTPGFTDTKEDAQQFISQHDYDFVYLLDANNLHQKLEVQGIPYKVFVDAQGDFIKTVLGSAGPEKDYEKVRQIIEEYKSL